MSRMPEYNPPDRSGTASHYGVGGQDGDYFFEYGVGYSPRVYEVQRGKLKALPPGVQHLVMEGHIGKAIEKRASDIGQHAGVVFEISRDGSARQVGNVEGFRRGARITWTRSSNARRGGIKMTKRARPILRPLEKDSRIRWETKWKVGDRGAVYEFNVKLFNVKLRNVVARFSDDDLYIETQHALKMFKLLLKQAYPWVGDVYFTGRSGGWLAVEDAKGKATERAILAIADRVDDARDEFVKYMKEEYG